MRLVLDASAIVAYVTDDRTIPVEPYFSPEHELHVPAISDVEVVAGLARQVRLGGLSDAAAREAVIDYVAMPIARHLHTRLIARTFELTRNFAPADASYVALAEALDASLVTMDRALGRAVRKHSRLSVLP